MTKLISCAAFACGARLIPMRDQTKGRDRISEWVKGLSPPTAARAGEILGKDKGWVYGAISGRHRVGMKAADILEGCSGGFIRVELFGFMPTEEQVAKRNRGMT